MWKSLSELLITSSYSFKFVKWGWWWKCLSDGIFLTWSKVAKGYFTALIVGIFFFVNMKHWNIIKLYPCNQYWGGKWWSISNFIGRLITVINNLWYLQENMYFFIFSWKLKVTLMLSIYLSHSQQQYVELTSEQKHIRRMNESKVEINVNSSFLWF